jgi:hypothetical protein
MLSHWLHLRLVPCAYGVGSDEVSLRSLSLFTGYGGLDLALEGYARPIGYCEIEPYAQGIIASRIADGFSMNLR